MKQNVTLLLIIVILLIGCSKEKIVGDGAIVTEDRLETNFTGISMSGANNVHVTQGAAFRVQLKGYGNLLSYYETRVINGVLKLGYKDVNIKNDNIEVFVTLPVLSMLSIAGSGNIEARGNFDGVNTFEAVISGSGNINLEKGTAQSFTSTISGSGNIGAFGMVADEAVVNISGSGNTEITVTSLLNVTISGSGDVYYKGNPRITSHVSGSRAVIPK